MQYITYFSLADIKSMLKNIKYDRFDRLGEAISFDELDKVKKELKKDECLEVKSELVDMLGSLASIIITSAVIDYKTGKTETQDKVLEILKDTYTYYPEGLAKKADLIDSDVVTITLTNDYNMVYEHNPDVEALYNENEIYTMVEKAILNLQDTTSNLFSSTDDLGLSTDSKEIANEGSEKQEDTAKASAAKVGNDKAGKAKSVKGVKAKSSSSSTKSAKSTTKSSSKTSTKTSTKAKK